MYSRCSSVKDREIGDFVGVGREIIGVKKIGEKFVKERVGLLFGKSGVAKSRVCAVHYQ
jgi:hypothetical protein